MVPVSVRENNPPGVSLPNSTETGPKPAASLRLASSSLSLAFLLSPLIGLAQSSAAVIASKCGPSALESMFI